MQSLILVEPHHLVREVLIESLENKNSFSQIIPAAGGKSLLNLINQNKVDIVVISTTIDDMSLLMLLNKLKRDFPTLKVLILASEVSLLLAKNFLDAGADGYIAKTATLDEFVVAIKELQENKKVIPDGFSNYSSSLEGGHRSAFDKLSKREVDVLLQMLKGKSFKEIAHSLHLSPKTISTYKGRIFEKLQAESIITIFLLAIEWGFIETKPYFSTELPERAKKMRAAEEVR